MPSGLPSLTPAADSSFCIPQGASHKNQPLISAAEWDGLATQFGLPDFDGPWIVLHTKSRQEKSLAADLTTLGIPHFLPLFNSIRFHGARKARVQVPMFPSYLFVRGGMEEAYQADRTHRVANIIKVVNFQQLGWEIRNLAFALSRNAEMDYRPGLVPGVRVEIISGPFRGLQGLVQSRSHLNRVFLQVGMLGAGVSLEVDASIVEVAA